MNAGAGRWSAALAAVWIAACGGGPAPADGAQPDGGVPGVAPPDIPWLAAGAPDVAPPAPPLLTPCPPGWREIDADGAPACDPWPEGGPATCAEGEAHFPGEPGCTPVGAPCPAGDFADGLPDDGSVLFVLASAPAGGDGTRARPFARIGEAAPGARSGMTIAVGRGTYDEVVVPPAGVTVQGACPALTRLVANGIDPRPAVVYVRAEGVRVAGLTIGGGPRVGAYVEGVEATFEGVVVDDAYFTGLFLSEQARLVARSVVVRETREARDGTLGRGLYADVGSTVEVTRAVFSGNHEVGIYVAESESPSVLEGVAVMDTRPSSLDGQAGIGVQAHLGGVIELRRSIVERSGAIGVLALGAGSTVRLADAVVRETRGAAAAIGTALALAEGGAAEVDRTLFEQNGLGVSIVEGSSATLRDVVVRDSRGAGFEAPGPGLEVGNGASATVTRALLLRGNDIGVRAVDPGSTLRLEDVVVRDTAGPLGQGLIVVTGAVVDVARIVVTANMNTGVLVDGDGSMLRGEDVVASDTVPDPTGFAGRGITVQRGGYASLDRVILERNTEVGLVAALASVRLADVVVRDIRPASDGMNGIGLAFQEGGTNEVSRALVERTAEAGIAAGGEGVSVRLADVVVRDIESSAFDGFAGRGMEVSRGARLEATRVIFERVREIGVYVVSPGTTVALGDFIVRGIRPAACGEGSCPGRASGSGLVSVSGSSLRAGRFVVTDSEQCGVQIASEAQMDLSEGTLSGHPIGICIQVPGYDTGRLTNGVRLSDNGVDVDTTSFDVPAPIDPVGTGP